MKDYEVIEQTLTDMPEGLYAIQAEDLDFIGETSILFARVDGDGDCWPLGKATQNDRLGGWTGYLDTKQVSFEDEDELKAELRRVMREEAEVL